MLTKPPIQSETVVIGDREWYEVTDGFAQRWWLEYMTNGDELGVEYNVRGETAAYHGYVSGRVPVGSLIIGDDEVPAQSVIDPITGKVKNVALDTQEIDEVIDARDSAPSFDLELLYVPVNEHE